MSASSLLIGILALGQSADLDRAKAEWARFGSQHGIKTAGAYKIEANVKDWKIEATPVRTSDLPAAKKFWAMFKSEFSKYPPCFLKKSGLKEVDFVSRVSIAGQYRGAMPDYVNDRLVLDVNLTAHPEWYVRHVIHHEFYHLVENKLNGSPYYKDPGWAKLNPSGFRYGQGGAGMRDPNVTPLVHPKKGFVNLYSTSGLEEDKAEVWAVMFCSRDWALVQPWLSGDAVLASKVKYMETFATETCQEMDGAFWKRTRKAK